MYLDSGPYPRYNCVVNLNNKTCASNCFQLLNSEYQLILVQNFNNTVQPAWKGLSNCNDKPKITLTSDTLLMPCQSGIRFKENVYIVILSCIFCFYFY